MIRLVLLTALLFQVSCADHNVKNYIDEKPRLILKDFFNGQLYALGIVQDRSGKVINRFKVNITASWNKDIATLDEDFLYSDGTKSKRVWTLKESNGRFYNGEASDVIGEAEGEVLGNTFYFEYILDIPVGDSNYRVKLKDWMFLLDENTLLARSYMTKWGVDLGEITIVMMKR